MIQNSFRWIVKQKYRWPTANILRLEGISCIPTRYMLKPHSMEVNLRFPPVPGFIKSLILFLNVCCRYFYCLINLLVSSSAINRVPADTLTLQSDIIKTLTDLFYFFLGIGENYGDIYTTILKQDEIGSMFLIRNNITLHIVVFTWLTFHFFNAPNYFKTKFKITQDVKRLHTKHYRPTSFVHVWRIWIHSFFQVKALYWQMLTPCIRFLSLCCHNLHIFILTF